MHPSSKDLINSKVISTYYNGKRKYHISNDKKEKIELKNYPEYLEKFGSFIYGEFFYLIDNQKKFSKFIKMVCQKALNTHNDSSTLYTVFFSHEIAGRPILFDLKIQYSYVELTFFRSNNKKSFSVEESSVYGEVFKYFSSKKISVNYSTQNKLIPEIQNQDISLLLKCSSISLAIQEIEELSTKSLELSSPRKNIKFIEEDITLKRAKFLNDAPLTHKLYELGSAIFSNNYKAQTALNQSKKEYTTNNEYLRLIGYLGFLIGGLMIYPLEYTGIVCGLTLCVFSSLFLGRKGLSMTFNATTTIAFAYNWKAAALFTGALITIGGSDFIEFYLDNVVMPVEEYFRGTEPSIPLQKI